MKDVEGCRMKDAGSIKAAQDGSSNRQPSHPKEVRDIVEI